MVFIRLSSFIFMLLFTLLEARDFIHKEPYYQGISETKVASQIQNTEAKAIHQNIVAKGIKSSSVRVEKEGTKTTRNGRKMVSESGFKNEKSKAKELAKMSMNDRSTKISGAAPSSSWNCNQKRKKKLDVLCKQSARTTPKKANFPPGFVALSADYHFPNSHPPRHN